MNLIKVSIDVTVSTLLKILFLLFQVICRNFDVFECRSNHSVVVGKASLTTHAQGVPPTLQSLGVLLLHGMDTAQIVQRLCNLNAGFTVPLLPNPQGGVVAFLSLVEVAHLREDDAHSK